jgi:hypothetical protein
MRLSDEQLGIQKEISIHEDLSRKGHQQKLGKIITSCGKVTHRILLPFHQEVSPGPICPISSSCSNCSLTIYVGRDIDFATYGAWKCLLLDWRFSGSMWEFPKKSNPKVSHGHAEYVNQLWLLAPRFREPRKWQLTGLEYNLPDPILWVSMLAFRRSIEEKVSLPFKRGGG